MGRTADSWRMESCDDLRFKAVSLLSFKDYGYIALVCSEYTASLVLFTVSHCFLLMALFSFARVMHNHDVATTDISSVGSLRIMYFRHCAYLLHTCGAMMVAVPVCTDLYYVPVCVCVGSVTPLFCVRIM